LTSPRHTQLARPRSTIGRNALSNDRTVVKIPSDQCPYRQSRSTSRQLLCEVPPGPLRQSRDYQGTAGPLFCGLPRPVTRRQRQVSPNLCRHAANGRRPRPHSPIARYRLYHWAPWSATASQRKTQVPVPDMPPSPAACGPLQGRALPFGRVGLPGQTARPGLPVLPALRQTVPFRSQKRKKSHFVAPGRATSPASVVSGGWSVPEAPCIPPVPGLRIAHGARLVGAHSVILRRARARRQRSIRGREKR